MVTIKIQLYELLTCIENHINKMLGSNIDIFNTNYHELYIKPKGTEIYIKCYKGKKVIYKPIQYFVNTEPFNDTMTICTKDNSSRDLSISFDYELSIEGSD